jgi:hypothetical protein
MNITERQVVIGLVAFMGIIIFLLFIGQLISGSEAISLVWTGFAVLVFAGLLFAYWRGWENARHTVVTITALLVALTQQEPPIHDATRLWT